MYFFQGQNTLSNADLQTSSFLSIFFNLFLFMICLVSQSRLTLCDPLHYSPSSSSVYGGSPGKNIGVGCQATLPADLS